MNIFENHTFADPRVPFIFHNYSFPASYNSNQTLNWHENIELIYIKKGDATARISGKDIAVSTGDIIIIGSNLLHGIVSKTSIEFYCLIIDRSFCLANHLDTNNIDFRIKLKDADIVNALENFADRFADETHPFRQLTLRASALNVLSLICSRYSHPKSQNSDELHLLSALKHSLGFIYSESHRELSLDEIASSSGLSKYYFAHEFKRLTGQTVISYLNGVRCEKATELLAANDLSIECIAIECGFSSASYFIKTFKKYYAISPSNYRKKFANQNTAPR